LTLNFGQVNKDGTLRCEREDVMRCTSKVFNAEFKVKVALKALVGRKTVNEIAGAYKVHPHQVVTRKREAQEGLKLDSQVFIA